MKRLLFVALVLLMSCKDPEEEKETVVNYYSLRIEPSQDTLFLNANNETRQLALLGSVINTTEITITNNGVMTEMKYIVKTVDTVFESVNVTKANWYSSDANVATVVNGLVTTKNPGYANITAQIGNTTSYHMSVNVRAVNSPPGLMLNPPDAILIFENFTIVSGFVQPNALLNISEPNSGFSSSNITPVSDGSFEVTVTGLNPGVRVITARATHHLDSTKFTERSKLVTYYSPGSLQANGIVGNWLGTTLGKDFPFKITYSPIFTRYDIEGTLDIQFEGIGLVKDIDLIGVLNSNGTINASLSKSYQGFTIAGKFNGYFKSTGTGQGEYSAQAIKSGWPKISFNDKWTAVKLP